MPLLASSSSSSLTTVVSPSTSGVILLRAYTLFGFCLLRRFASDVRLLDWFAKWLLAWCKVAFLVPGHMPSVCSRFRLWCLRAPLFTASLDPSCEHAPHLG